MAKHDQKAQYFRFAGRARIHRLFSFKNHSETVQQGNVIRRVTSPFCLFRYIIESLDSIEYLSCCHVFFSSFSFIAHGGYSIEGKHHISIVVEWVRVHVALHLSKLVVETLEVQTLVTRSSHI